MKILINPNQTLDQITARLNVLGYKPSKDNMKGLRLDDVVHISVWRDEYTAYDYAVHMPAVPLNSVPAWMTDYTPMDFKSLVEDCGKPDRNEMLSMVRLAEEKLASMIKFRPYNESWSHVHDECFNKKEALAYQNFITLELSPNMIVNTVESRGDHKVQFTVHSGDL